MLHGPAATGKRAAALRLLSRLAFGPTPTRLYELNPDLDLADLRPDAPLPDTALLLECSHAAIVHADPLPVRNPAPRARAPGRTPLRAAAAATTRWSSSPTAARGRAWGLSRRVLDWPDTAALQRLVVVKHLQHALGRTDADPAPADGQAAPDAPQTTSIPSPPASTPSWTTWPWLRSWPLASMAQLADWPRPCCRGARRPAAASLAWLARCDADVAAWFADDARPGSRRSSPRPRITALADEVKAAGAALAARTCPPSRRPRIAPLPDPFRCGAHSSPLPGRHPGRPGGDDHHGSHYGETTARTLQLRKFPAWQQAVLAPRLARVHRPALCAAGVAHGGVQPG
ncbi:MAG: hypothetical protein R2854_30585 [Caldilineaceae bacterium]